MKTINQDIKEENFRPVYLLYGEEDFLRRAYEEPAERSDRRG